MGLSSEDHPRARFHFEPPSGHLASRGRHIPAHYLPAHNFRERTVTRAKNVSDYIQQLHPYRDGNSSARVLEAVEQVLQGHLTTAKKKPLNLLRNFKLRKKLNYWKFN